MGVAMSDEVNFLAKSASLRVLAIWEITMRFTKVTSLLVPCVVLILASEALAAGDVDKGKRLAKKQCAICHTLQKGGGNRLGPNLFNVFGRQVASVKDYKYSKAMASSEINWDEAAFTEFLTKPKNFIKGTKMGYAGLKKATQRADILAYFKTLRDTTPQETSVGNAVRGKVVAKELCRICHSFNKGGKLVLGPNLFGIFGKPAGAIKGYKYSKAMLASGITWTDANLIEFLANPNQFIKGTKAQFPGVKNPQKRADIIAYLKTLK